MPSKYDDLGVDVYKRGIEVFEDIVSNVFPQAFCVVTQDPVSPNRGIVLHTDGAGSKPVQSYLHWRETGSPDYFKGLAQDVVAMNLDDIICVGAQPLAFVDYIAINSFRVDKRQLLKALSEGFRECIENLNMYGLNLAFSGGETADLPDQVRTLDVSGTILGSVDLKKAVKGDSIQQSDLIVGLRSDGRSRYERTWNSGIMCNGITLARYCLMKKEYCMKYPELLESTEKPYYGRFGIDDYVDDLGMTVGEAILSPCRIYAPVILEILEELGEQVSGLIHNTGGGQTKCLRVGRNIHYVKDLLEEPPPIFKLIKEESGETWRNMYKIYNMGVGFEVIVRRGYADDAIAIAEKYGIKAKVVGRCLKSDGVNKLTLTTPYGKLLYSRS
ncbi:phosphoribosylformylglycinamidine cyclo-ligase [Candidatus Bathyarchaeota archaeon]|nr:phosphoribosylformylglycinamidine cyclo-ligase [Candidatus Bathyarchaeota archaeon]